MLRRILRLYVRRFLALDRKRIKYLVELQIGEEGGLPWQYRFCSDDPEEIVIANIERKLLGAGIPTKNYTPILWRLPDQKMVAKFEKLTPRSHN